MILKLKGIKYGGKRFDSVIILDSNYQWVLAPSLYLINLSINIKSQTTILNYAYTLNRYFDYLSKKSIEWFDVDDSEMSKFINSISQNLQEASVGLYSVILKEFYDYGWKYGFLSHPKKFNYFLFKQPNNKEVTKALIKQYIEPSKFLGLLGYIEGKNEFFVRRNELILCIGYYLGLRRSEITNPENFALTDIDKVLNRNYNDKCISIIGKGKVIRDVPLDRRMEEMIYKFRNSKLFPKNAKNLITSDKGKPIGSQNPYLIYRGASKRTLSHYWNKRVFHSLRHSFATNMVTLLRLSGVENYHIYLAERMGHKNPETTKIYVSFEDAYHSADSINYKMTNKPKYFAWLHGETNSIED